MAPRGRGCLVAGAVSLPLGWTGLTLYRVAAGRPLLFGSSPATIIAVGLALTGLALWCAFGTEGWHVGPNCLEHRAGIGGWRHVRRYRDAELEIIRRQNQYGRSYYRLYVVVGATRHFVLERGLLELSRWADLVARQTGWPPPDTA